jgi:hypothetical protein
VGSPVLDRIEAEQLRYFLTRIVEETAVPAERRDDIEAWRPAAMQARNYALAALRTA